MLKRISRKMITVVGGVLALLLIVGAGTALAARYRGGFQTAPAAATPSATATAQEQELIGIVQSIDQNKQTFVLLQAGQAKTVTIAFDAKTNTHNEHRTLQLTVGMHVLVHATVRSDGSLYATEIEPAAAAHDYGAGYGSQPGVSNGTCIPGSAQGPMNYGR